VGRILGYLASFVAVVGGCVAFVRWLDSEDVPVGVLVLVIGGIPWLLGLIHRAVFPPEHREAFPERLLAWLLGMSPWLRAVLVLSPFVAGIAVVLSGLLEGDAGDAALLGGTALLFAIAVAPLVWDFYERDKASRKQCPDWCEDVKVGARVRRYCGHRWADAEGCEQP
jgi:hypothetical protein